MSNFKKVKNFFPEILLVPTVRINLVGFSSLPLSIKLKLRTMRNYDGTENSTSPAKINSQKQY